MPLVVLLRSVAAGAKTRTESASVGLNGRTKETLYQYVRTTGARHGVSGAVGVAGGAASGGLSAAHVSEGEKSRQEGIRLNTPANAGPVRERPLRPVHQVEDFAPRKSMSRVVVRFVARFLKIEKSARDADEFRLQRLPIQTRVEFW